MNRTITVEGTGKVLGKPDRILLNFRLLSEDKEYEKAMVLSDSKYDKLLSSLEKAGLAKEELKTKEMRVLTKYDQEFDGKIYRQVFMGYEITYNLELSLGMDLKKLNSLLGEISKQGSTPEFSIIFDVKDDSPMKKEALGKAAQDAKTRADVLAEAMDLKLGEVMEMTTLDHQVGFSSKIEYPTMKMTAMDLDITPQDIENLESVKMTFQIL